jgi:hypothetical protein
MKRKNNNLIQQPESNPQERFLDRTEAKCPTHLDEKQKTSWLKAGEKARKNQTLLDTTNAFYWPESYYGRPVHVHAKTPAYVIESLLQTVANIHLYTIDTESDKPTKIRPKPVPALIQIQAIRNENSATVILLEVQHLPNQSSSLFLIILICLISPILLIHVIYKTFLHVRGTDSIHILQNVLLIIN